jgi:hypothetical protein
MRGMTWSAPRMGTLPTFGPTCPNRARSEAIVRSDMMLSSLPAPMHQPLTAAMMGLPQVRMAAPISITTRSCSRPSCTVRVAWVLTSPPEQNALSPAPVSTITPIVGSAVAIFTESRSSS